MDKRVQEGDYLSAITARINQIYSYFSKLWQFYRGTEGGRKTFGMFYIRENCYIVAREAATLFRGHTAK